MFPVDIYRGSVLSWLIVLSGGFLLTDMEMSMIVGSSSVPSAPCPAPNSNGSTTFASTVWMPIGSASARNPQVSGMSGSSISTCSEEQKRGINGSKYRGELKDSDDIYRFVSPEQAQAAGAGRQSGRRRRARSSPAETCFSSTFPMFVPSLSW